MKKLIAMIATVAVVLSLGVTSLAKAESDKRKSEEKKKPVASATYDGVKYSSPLNKTDITSGSDQDKKLKDIVKDNGWANSYYVSLSAQKFELKDDGTYEAKNLGMADLNNATNGRYNVTFSNLEDSGKITGAYLWINGDMKKFDIERTNDGIVVKDLYQDGNFRVYFVYGTEAQAEEAAPSNGVTSPSTGATGYNTTAYIVCAIALAAGAAFFFGTSKKSAKEMM